jgi:glycogen phosphorylase
MTARARDNVCTLSIVNRRLLSQPKSWSVLHIGEVTAQTEGGQHVIEAQVYFDTLDPEAVRVEIYGEGVAGDAPVRQDMQGRRQLLGATHAYVYQARVFGGRPVADYKVRIVPKYRGAAVPIEAPYILRQR